MKHIMKCIVCKRHWLDCQCKKTDATDGVANQYNQSWFGSDPQDYGDTYNGSSIQATVRIVKPKEES